MAFECSFGKMGVRGRVPQGGVGNGEGERGEEVRMSGSEVAGMSMMVQEVGDGFVGDEEILNWILYSMGS